MPTRAFTLIELLVVIAIIAALAAIAVPVLTMVRGRAARAATASVVQTVATLVATSAKALAVDEPAGAGTVRRTYRNWDVNGDGIVDGDPQRENDHLPAAERYSPAVVASGYRGLAIDTAAVLPKRHVDPATARVIDSWGQPLRIAFGLPAHGSLGFGVWSTGPDRQDDGTGPAIDDLRSWELGHD